MRFTKPAAVLSLLALPLAGAAQAAPITTQCGPLIKSIVKTDIDFFTTNSEIPVNFKGAAANFTVPAGATNCVRVRFSAVANCPLSCFMRALVDTTEMKPAWFSNALRFSTDDTNGGTAHSFEWVTRVSAGQHTVRLTMQTGNTIENANIGPWTFAVDIQE
jgi:hypothetical protein